MFEHSQRKILNKIYISRSAAAASLSASTLLVMLLLLLSLSARLSSSSTTSSLASSRARDVRVVRVVRWLLHETRDCGRGIIRYPSFRAGEAARARSVARVARARSKRMKTNETEAGAARDASDGGLAMATQARARALATQFTICLGR